MEWIAKNKVELLQELTPAALLYFGKEVNNNRLVTILIYDLKSAAYIDVHIIYGVFTLDLSMYHISGVPLVNPRMITEAIMVPKNATGSFTLYGDELTNAGLSIMVIQREIGEYRGILKLQ